jgi:membrane-bound metal-dependent hydrolase YbcI (DUF457 family)
MTLPTHVLAGLIIGKITGDFPTALVGSLIIDLDHTISYIRHGIVFKPRRLLTLIFDKTDPWGDQRNFLHNIFSWLIISSIIFIINFKVGLVLFIAYFFHLVFDALDTVDYYPFFPSRKVAIKGFVHYRSQQEIIFDACLVLIFVALFII